jgi:hypothetical protein
MANFFYIKYRAGDGEYRADNHHGDIARAEIYYTANHLITSPVAPVPNPDSRREES